MTVPAADATTVEHERALAVFDRWYQAHESRDLSALRTVLAADAEVHSLFRREPARSRDAAIAHFVRTTETFGGLAMDLVSTPAAAANGAVLAEVMFSGKFSGTLTFRDRLHHGGSQHFELPGVVIVHTRGEEVASVRTLYDRDLWLRQIGVPDC